MPLTISSRSGKGLRPRLDLERTCAAPRARRAHDAHEPEVDRMNPSLIERVRRQALFREGTSAGTIYEIVEGGVIIFKTLGDGRRQIFDILGPGALIGTATGQSYNYSAECLTKCRFIKYSAGELEGSQPLQSRLSQQLLRMIETLQEHAVLLGRRTAMERIAHFLLALPQLSVRLGRQPGEALVQTALKQRDIGDYLGLKVETVSRNLAILKRRMIIATGKRGQFRLLDPVALQRIAEP